MEIFWVERGKPRERATQIKVGALFNGNSTRLEVVFTADR